MSLFDIPANANAFARVLFSPPLPTGHEVRLQAAEEEQESWEPDELAVSTADNPGGHMFAHDLQSIRIHAGGRLWAIDSVREVFEPQCLGCGGRHAPEQTCLRWASGTGIPAASGAVDASPPVESGDLSPSHQPTGGPQLEDLDKAARIVRAYAGFTCDFGSQHHRDLIALSDRLTRAPEAEAQ